MSKVSLDRQTTEIALRILEGLATPVSLKVAILIRYECWDAIAECKVSPDDYICPNRFKADAQAVSLFRKMRDLPTSFDRKAVAEGNFVKCEHMCNRTNQRLNPYLHPHIQCGDFSEDVALFFKRARKICSSILGRLPDFLEGRFGPGSTYGDRGSLTTIPDKMSSRPTLTTDASYHLYWWEDTAWARACAASGRHVDFVRGNRFLTVPKDCTKDRGIAVEPSLNVFYQLAFGSVVRRKLKSQGIDLDHGQDTHRQVACEASIRGDLCTLDLSNASDTVSRNLVKLLLPPLWFDALDDLRSKMTQFKGKWFLLEKFSSMGNGFTFELETLIFLCLILALDTDHKLVPGVNVFVYGDDIIVPTEISKDVISMLKFSGMEVNETKSFVSGPFRESCGGDFFLGVDVRPHFLKESPYEPQHFISFANGLRRAFCSSVEAGSLRRAWFSILDAVPSHIRSCRGPSVLGDLLVHDNESRWQFRHRHGIRYFKVYKPAEFLRVQWAHFTKEVMLAAAVYGLSSNGERSSIQLDTKRPPWSHAGVSPRDNVKGYNIGWVPYS